MVAMMNYKKVNPRDQWGGEKDARGGLLGFIRAIRAIRGSLPELDLGFHGVHGFPAAWPRWIWVKPSRTQSHSVKPRTADHGPLALLCGFLGKGQTSFCKSLISMIVSVISDMFYAKAWRISAAVSRFFSPSHCKQVEERGKRQSHPKNEMRLN
jgi:hypothetical protein